MSTPARTSHLTVWALAGLAVILLYLLSAPALRYATGVPIAFSRGPSYDPREEYGRACLASLYAAPYDWMEEHTLLRPLLRPYTQWWYARQ